MLFQERRGDKQGDTRLLEFTGDRPEECLGVPLLELGQ